jgi:hypothetical protein
VLDAIAFAPRLTAFCRLNELGRVVVGQRLEPKRAMLACRVIAGDRCAVVGAGAKDRHGTA